MSFGEEFLFTSGKEGERTRSLSRAPEPLVPGPRMSGLWQEGWERGAGSRERPSPPDSSEEYPHSQGLSRELHYFLEGGHVTWDQILFHFLWTVFLWIYSSECIVSSLNGDHRRWRAMSTGAVTGYEKQQKRPFFSNLNFTSIHRLRCFMVKKGDLD